MTELSPAERARLDDLEARPAAEESCIERVARAMHAAETPRVAWEVDVP